jgi:hypothetical protein
MFLGVLYDGVLAEVAIRESAASAQHVYVGVEHGGRSRAIKYIKVHMVVHRRGLDFALTP